MVADPGPPLLNFSLPLFRRPDALHHFGLLLEPLLKLPHCFIERYGLSDELAPIQVFPGRRDHICLYSFWRLISSITFALSANASLSFSIATSTGMAGLTNWHAVSTCSLSSASASLNPSVSLVSFLACKVIHEVSYLFFHNTQIAALRPSMVSTIFVPA